ncbi:type I-E CRISPR-associated protein Cas7/Cse4/CasC [Deinococcus planocerae]|uniref:type I-E CRISPR-associated protein Cas7/Cse4/CasC n=1 Tax=Deinococcus planocerae TaxID=1737569 RepID=UPI000C7E956B|nr:type I-E CRISPR-associated protein Cas7/Cse4/CasC [Deinococcus planocerae]
MKALLELHYLQNFAPSNLNRDDTGSPKDAYFGGVRRARISSQSFKRAMRMDFRERELLGRDELGERTKRAHEAVARRLAERGHGEEEARRAAENALQTMGTQKQMKITKDGKTEYLAFLGREELEKLAEVIHRSFDLFSATRYKPEKDTKATLEACLINNGEGKNAVDIALFGRMLANLPDKNADAAAQVAHAIGTHALRGREFDFYTAVDDLKPGDTAGADMLGTVEFGSATFYRYACLDLAKLRENLGGDTDLALRGLRAFLYASVFAAPTGKQNTFAAHNLPSLLVQVVRENASPRNLANAFEDSRFRKEEREDGEGYMLPSINRLASEMDWQNRVFGDTGNGRYISRHETEKVHIFGDRIDSVDALIEATLADVRSLYARLGG